MPSQRRRLRAAELSKPADAELTRICVNLQRLRRHSPRDFAAALDDFNRLLSKHDRGFVRGFFAGLEADK